MVSLVPSDSALHLNTSHPHTHTHGLLSSPLPRSSPVLFSLSFSSLLLVFLSVAPYTTTPSQTSHQKAAQLNFMTAHICDSHFVYYKGHSLISLLFREADFHFSEAWQILRWAYQARLNLIRGKMHKREVFYPLFDKSWCSQGKYMVAVAACVCVCVWEKRSHLSAVSNLNHLKCGTKS